MRIACTACDYSAPLEEAVHPCPRCGEPVEVRYDRGEIDPAAAIAGRGRQQGILSDMAPVLPPFTPAERVSLGEGGTPLIRLANLGRRLGLPNLFLKYEGANPTGSFKDRGTAVALTHAVRLGRTRVGTVSSGNMAASVAAYAARAGLRCHLMVPAHLRPEKVFTIAVYGPDLYRVEGDYSSLYREALALGRERGIFFAVSDDPLRVEGQKTTGYEVVRDLAHLGLTPSHVFNPTSSGGHTAGLLKGFEEMLEYGAIARRPAVIAVQPDGCAPIAKAFARGDTRVTRVERPQTRAHAIQNPLPPSGNRVLRALARAGRGAAVAVTDEAMRRAQLALAAEEGLFVQMESAASLSAAEEWRRAGRLNPDDVVVLIGTGSGLKDPGAFTPNDFPIIEVKLEELGRALPPG